MESIISQTKFLQSKIPEDICHSQNCVVETSDRTLPPHDNPPLTPGGHLESDASNGVASLDFLARATEYAGLGTENNHKIESAVEGIIAPELRNETNGGATHLETSGGVSVENIFYTWVELNNGTTALLPQHAFGGTTTTAINECRGGDGGGEAGHQFVANLLVGAGVVDVPHEAAEKTLSGGDAVNKSGGGGGNGGVACTETFGLNSQVTESQALEYYERDDSMEEE